MPQWNLTFTGKRLKRKTVEKIAEELLKKLGGDAGEVDVRVTDVTTPETRHERYTAAQALVEEGKSEFQNLYDELQAWLDNVPENLRESNKAEQLQEAIDSLTEAIDHCDNVVAVDISFPAAFG